MAKGGMNIVEQHLEKGILGLCILSLLVVVYIWVLSSPEKIEMNTDAGNMSLTPSTVDAAVKEYAEKTRAVVNAKQLEVPPVPPYVDKIRDLQNKPLAPKYALADMGSPGPVIGDANQPTPEKASLPDLITAMPRPGKPMVKADRELPAKSMDKPAEVLIAHVVATYPIKELTDAWSEKLKKSGMMFYRPAPVGLEAEVQEQLPDGSWSEPRSVQKVTMPLVDTSGQPITVPEMPNYDGKNVVEIANIRSMLSDPSAGWQSDLIQPEYWQILWPSYGWVDWKVNLPKTPVSEMYEADMAAGSAQGGGAVVPTSVARPVPAPMLTMTPSLYGRRIPRGEEEVELDDRPARRLPIMNIPGGAVTPGMPAVPGEPNAGVSAPVPTVVPPLDYQIQKNMLLLWFHDGSLESNKVYRYCLRLKLLNPLLGYETLVTSPAFATTATLLTQRSDWSDPVYVPRATEFFLTGASPAQGSVTVTVFARSLGQQVMQKFTVGAGQSIGGTKQVDQLNPINNNLEKQTVDFSTGAIAVEFDFNRPMPQGKTGVEMVYLDGKGKLQVMTDIRTAGKGDPDAARYKELLEKARLLSRATGAALAASATTQPATPAPGTGMPGGKTPPGKATAGSGGSRLPGGAAANPPAGGGSARKPATRY